MYYNIKLKQNSQKLRSNMTDAEKLLWSQVRKKQMKAYQFYRQRIIGNYIIDFYCPKAKLAIELDGGQHFTGKGIRKDFKRDKYLNSLGIEVLRFDDYVIFTKTQTVLEEIFNNLP